MAEVEVSTDDGVLIVTLNRPERLNAMTGPLVRGLSLAWLEAAERDDIRAVIVTGSGRGFCAGADLLGDGSGRDPLAGLRHAYNPHVLGLASLRQPVIAAVNGPAAGAGLALACAADIRIASTAGQFVPAFAKLGLVPDAGASYFLPRLIGHPRATEWLLRAYPVDAATALEWGLVTEVVEPDALLSRAVEIAREITAHPRSGIGLTKQLLRRSWQNGLGEQLDLEAGYQNDAIASPDAQEARAAWLARANGSVRHG